MTRMPVPLTTPDLSGFARTLAAQLQAKPAPSHLELLNMLARAGGFRNFQHLRAGLAARDRLATRAPEPTTDHTAVERALRHFDGAGVMVRWPSRRALQELCLWALWPLFPLTRSLHEREVNAILATAHGFADAALLRRDMLGLSLLTRSADCTDYRRIARTPPPEAAALIRLVTARRNAAATG